MSYIRSQTALFQHFRKARQVTEERCAPLQTEDYIPQPIANVSPPKWHLAHTTWFFEEFVLKPYLPGYKVFHPKFSFLFNSYYNTVGEQAKRINRGLITRPGVEEVYAYRAYTDEAMSKLFEEELSQEVLKVIEIGIYHEEQHQELLIYDLKYILGTQPLCPHYADGFQAMPESAKEEWRSVNEGIYEIGTDGKSFSYDNEKGRHKVLLEPFEIRTRLATAGEFSSFIEAGGYQDHRLWHSEAWAALQESPRNAPLYWSEKGGDRYHYTLRGLEKVQPDSPVMHLSFHEAFALAEFLGYRLPTEFEWEAAADSLKWGQLWEWTSSAYLPYPRFAKDEGALGEYNGKFMLNQNVLRGASLATPEGHSRKTYRNFFSASSRWIFSGVRFVKK